MPGRFRTAALVACVLLVASTRSAFAQSAGTESVSASFTVSVIVTRSCGVTTPSSATSSTAARSDVTISCGRAPASSSLFQSGLLTVSGTRAPASVSTSKSERGLVVSVNF